MARASSRLTSVHVNTSQNNSGCEVLQRVYRPAGRSHILKMRICVHIVGSAIAAKYTPEGEGLAGEGWNIKPAVIAAICTDFSETFFEAIVKSS